MKRWAIIGLVIVAFGALAGTGRLWLPSLLGYAIDNEDTVAVVGTGLQVLIGVLGLIVSAAAYLRTRNGGKPRSVKADQGGIAIGGDAEGSAIAAGGGVAAGGDFTSGVTVTGRDAKVEVTVSPERPAPPQASPLHQLPPPPGDFTGRETELDDLLREMERGGVTISGIQGMGGVGKTLLALKVGELLADRYCDAQIYLNLRGAGMDAFSAATKQQGPLTSAQAMAHVVRSFDPTAQVPESESELGGMYMSVLHGKRALLFMDNALDGEQVKLLIPPEGCVLLVTSRKRFVLPGLFAMDLDTMEPDDARGLLLAIAPRIGDEAGEIARLCARWPAPWPCVTTSPLQSMSSGWPASRTGWSWSRSRWP